MRRAPGAGLAGALVLAAACATDPGVRTEGAMAIASDTTATADESGVPVEWGACPGIGAHELTTDWECGWVTVPLDRGEPGGATVEVALSRPVLEGGDDRRPLVINPGGPGAPGVEFVWTFADVLPPELLDVFYPVGWDPRGVGLSRPAIECGPADEMGIPDPGECVERTGELLGFVGAADAALDLEEVRLALGVDRLDYLGYSYGTALGAVYAMAHPDGVGQFVLDGAIDPSAGDPDNPLALDGAPDYSADELDAVVARFRELCDASTECAAGPDSGAVIDGLRGTIRGLPTAHFAGDPEELSRLDLDELIDGAMYDPWTWGLIGDALRDAADGDASTLAALSAYGLEVATEGSSDQFAAANFAIHCADFSDVPDRWGCDGMPAAADLPVISTVDVAAPILVIGTQYDPATPGRHAEELAAALGDAVAMRWEGLGHTAYPVSECVDGAVDDFLIDGRLPAAGTSCPFVDGETTDEGIADVLFGYPRPWIDGWIESELVYDGSSEEEATCLAGALGGRGPPRPDPRHPRGHVGRRHHGVGLGRRIVLRPAGF